MPEDRIHMLRGGEPGHGPAVYWKSILEFLKKIDAGLLVTDFDPLRIKKRWKNEVGRKIGIPIYEVDAHNIVPCRMVSHKPEYAARTFRPKLHKLLPGYLTEFPAGITIIRWKNLKMLRHMTSTGTLHRRKWSGLAKCTDICGCTGLRKYLNGLNHRKKQLKLPSV
jgi:hypothetical protein